MRELARTFGSSDDQKAFLASLSNAVDMRARYFPMDPLEYVDRVRKFLTHAFLPQLGPLLLSLGPKYPPERISRSECWQMVHLELSLLDGTHRPVEELHIVISDVITVMTRNEFPLHVAPRWLIDLFSVLERVVALKMEKNRWSIRPSVPMDTAGQAFVEAILKDVDGDPKERWEVFWE